MPDEPSDEARLLRIERFVKTNQGLAVSGTSVYYGKARAVHEVSFEAPSGAVSAIAGPNGAGKTSLILAIYGTVRSTGKITVAGDDVSGLPPRRRARRIAMVPQGRQLFPNLTVRENLRVMADMLPPSSVDAALSRFPVLEERSTKPAGVMSGGEQQMLVVTRALMGNPEVLLLDEVMTGLAPLVVSQLADEVRKLAQSGVAVVMAEPSIRALSRIIDRGYVLIRGEIVAFAESGEGLGGKYEQAMGFQTAS
jgi:branched-chain amino acid transport system ATP-binding protein